MPLQNRVLPTGEIVAAPWRGALMGNRGCLHDAAGRFGAARWRHANWVCCVTEFRGRHRAPMPPGEYTALFFWDEACALAAGHRPCAQCRYADWRRFLAAWQAAGLPGARAATIDRTLHAARVTRDRRQVRRECALSDLPDGAFLSRPQEPEAPLLKWQGLLWRWSADGYAEFGRVGTGIVTVLTPAPAVAAIRAGYRPAVRIAPR